MGELMKCPQCEADLIEPRGYERYCEECGYPEENRVDSTIEE
jgi:exosome complex RNA-binding protein Csl4